MLQINVVPTQYMHQTWPLVRGFIEDALTKGDPGIPLYSLDNILQYLVNGDWELFIAVEDGKVIGSTTVSYINYPLQRIAVITTVGGRHIIDKRSFSEFMQILKTQRGVTLVQAFGRESIVRLWRRYNFKTRNTLVELPL